MLGGFWIEIGLVVAAASLVCYYFIRERYRFFKKRNIPYKVPLFPVGNLLNVFLFKENFIATITKIYDDFLNARIFGVFMGLQPVYVVRDPEIVYRVLIKDFSHFHDRGLKVDEKVNPLEGHLFNMEGTKWKTLRNKLTPVFTSGKLKGMYSLMDACVEHMISMLDGEVDKEIEIKDALARLTTDVIGSCAFGIDSEAIKDPNSEFRQWGKKMFNPGPVLLLKNLFRTLLPELFIKLKMKSIPEDMHNFFHNVTKQNFEMRLKDGKKRNDFMQLLLELKQKGYVATDTYEQRDDDDEDSYLHKGEQHLQGGEQLELTDDLLTAQAFVFFAAGFETSATAMSFVMYLMSKYPDVQTKVRLEIQEAKEKFGGFSYEALKSMKYLDACINETMRMYPPFGLLFRKCNKTLRIDDELSIDEGYGVFIPIEGIHNDPAIFPEPRTFKPERFLNDSITPGTFIPFGDGPRICIAQRFALVEVKLVLAKLLYRYRIETCPKMAANEPIKIDPKSFIPQVLGGLHVRLRKNNYVA